MNEIYKRNEVFKKKYIPKKFRIVEFSDFYQENSMYQVQEALYYKKDIIGWLPKVSVATLKRAEFYIDYFINNDPKVYKEYE